MKKIVVSFSVGLIFSIGLGLSGMTQPQKVLGFLDIFGNWDATLIFVMGGAVGLHFITYRLIRKLPTPLLEPQWDIPTNEKITLRLICGSLLFGTGWGLAGYCPGPALTTFATGNSQIVIFLTSMLFGMFLFKLIEKKLPLGNRVTV